MDVGAPAVVAAIHDATGVWIHDLPATPERILAAMGATAPVGRRPRRRVTTIRFTVNGTPAELDVPARAACSTSSARTSA